MKNLLLLLFVFQLTNQLFSQTEYFISPDNKEVPEPEAVYKRKVEKIKKNHWAVSDYYLDGTLQMTGTYESKKLLIEKDTFIWYFIDGQIQTIVSYINGKRHGDYKSFFFDGKKYKTGKYKNGKRDGKWITWDFEGNISRELEYSSGKPVNTWLYYDSNGEIEYKIENANEEKVENVIQPAKLKNNESFSEYFETIKYPESVIKEKLIGYTCFAYTINTEGEVQDIEAIIPTEPRLNAIVIEHIKNFPPCEPAVHYGKKINQANIVPLNFTLTGSPYNITNSEKADYFYFNGLEAVQNKDYEKAIRRLIDAVKFKPYDAQMNYLLGQIYYKENYLPQACKYFTLTYTFQPDKVGEELLKKCNIKK